MFHHRDRLIKLERWVRIIAWINLAGAGLKLIGFIILEVGISINPAAYYPPYISQNVNWYLAGMAGFNILSLLSSLFLCLLFFGLSYTIRYLLALKDSIRCKPHMRS